jgi:AhpD family alkylhydroperoxidase
MKSSSIAYQEVAPEAFKALYALSGYVHKTSLSHQLAHLIYMRVSQINRCAFCLDMHSQDARAAGETEQRLYALSAWRDTPFFTDRERAALAWAETVTELGPGAMPDAVFDEARRHFDERELVDLTMATIVINGWNRLNIACRKEAGGYTPAAR